MGAATTPARICPECGTPNSGLSLFCSECGASLTNAATVSEPDDQTTAAFRPVMDEATAPDPYATQEFRPEALSPDQTTAAGVAAVSQSRVAPMTAPAGYLRQEESRRGLVLGWTAGVLILLVIGYLGWTSFLDPDTRDSIIGVFT